MNLRELKESVDRAVDMAEEIGESPDEIVVSLQLEDGTDATWSDSDVELHYDNNTQASGCVLTGYVEKGSDHD